MKTQDKNVSYVLVTNKYSGNEYIVVVDNDRAFECLNHYRSHDHNLARFVGKSEAKKVKRWV